MKEPAIVKSPDTLRQERIPPNQRETDDFPILHYGQIPPIDIQHWNFSISGLVEKEVVLSFQDFIALPRLQVFSDIHCVTGWSKLNNLWEGVSTGAVRDLAKMLPQARFVMVHGANDFTTNLPLEEFFQPDVLFALKHNHNPLGRSHGYPVRLVVPRLYLWKSAKWLTGIEFMAEDRPGFWEVNGYHMHGDPWREERYSD